MEKKFYFKTYRFLAVVNDHTITLSRKDPLKIIEFGSKTISLKDITSIQIKPAKTLTRGYIQFIFPGSFESKGSIEEAFKDENSIIFMKKDNQTAEDLKSHIESIIHKQQPEQQQSTTTSVADEIRKLKELLDEDILTQEEFDAEKTKLLEL